jgi:hypothetical protein
VRDGKRFFFKLTSTQSDEGPYGPCPQGCGSSKGARRGKASQVVKAPSSVTGGGVEAVLASPQLVRASVPAAAPRVNGESQIPPGRAREATGMSEVRSLGTWRAEKARHSKAERSTEAVSAS